MEAREPKITKLWEETKEWSMHSFREVYGWLGVKFDHYFFESEVTEEAQKIVEDGLKSGVLANSQGAVGIDFNDIGLGFAMVRKSDGTILYSTRDLALARRKFDEFKVERSIYVVASEQELHFKQVFKVLERMGFPQVKNCYHLSYGLVMIPEGKMSSRNGTVILFSALKDKLLTQIKEVNFKDIDTSGWSDTEINDTAQKIAVSAIRYGMIASDPKKTIVFDMPQWLSFNGDTGPYLLYTYVRMRSILRKGEFTGKSAGYVVGEIFEGSDEKALLKRIINLTGAVERAVKDQAPAPLAGYLFDFCQEFNSFYAKTSILKQEDPARKNTYLALVAALAETLKTGASLLGIEMPERM
jgi:arginyl-tRNA synthetase